MESIFRRLKSWSTVYSTVPQQVQQSIERAVLMRRVNAVLAVQLQERIPASRNCVTGTAYNARKRSKHRTQLYVAGIKLGDNLILNVSLGEHARGRGNIAKALPKDLASPLVGR
jgi:hypothetical protein